MFDIEIIRGEQVALVTPDSPGTKMLQTINRALMMKRLASDTPEVRPCFSRREITSLCGSMVATNFDRDSRMLERLGLIQSEFGREYTFTEFGVEVLKRLRDGEEEIEIYLYN